MCFLANKMCFILILKNKYFQIHGLQNMWDWLNDGWNYLPNAILLSTEGRAQNIVCLLTERPPGHPPHILVTSSLSLSAWYKNACQFHKEKE